MKIGRKNEIKIDPLAYNIALIGESGIGKSTIIKEFCEKLCGDSYLFLNVGKEDGFDAINGINYVTCPEWEAEHDEDANTIGFSTFVDTVLENRTTDFADLRVVVIDTLDELFSIVEPFVIALHNRENPTKRVKSIKAAFGGYMAGEDKAIELVLDRLWALKSVGVSFIIIGHTKNRNQIDVVTGEEYTQLTTNLSQRYFNAIKTKVHFLGVAHIDREIVREKANEKANTTGKDGKKGVIKSEARVITLRDDDFSVDSKSRFSNIESCIPLDSDALIKAITDAIKAEHSKSGVSIEESAKKQDEEKKKKLEQIAQQEAAAKSQKELDSIIEEIVTFCTENKEDINKLKPMLLACKEKGYANPKEIANLEDAKAILALTLE